MNFTEYLCVSPDTEGFAYIIAGNNVSRYMREHMCANFDSRSDTRNITLFYTKILFIYYKTV